MAYRAPLGRGQSDERQTGTGSRSAKYRRRMAVGRPTNIGGRFNFIRQHPDDPMTLFAGSSAGGLWKGSNSGTWQPLTEDFPAMAMGTWPFTPATPIGYSWPPAIADRQFSRIGNGICRSLDGGGSWKHGLDSMGVSANCCLSLVWTERSRPLRWSNGKPCPAQRVPWTVSERRCGGQLGTGFAAG